MREILLWTSALLICGATLACRAEQNGEIISDSFSGVPGDLIAGRIPDRANVPGGKWSQVGFDLGGSFRATVGMDATTGSSCANLFCAGNSTGEIAIAVPAPSPGAKRRQWTISADLRGANASLGFYSALPAQDPDDAYDAFAKFTGLRLGSGGELALYRGGGLVATVSYTGTFDPAVFHQLGYEVDTLSGEICHVILQGSNSDYSGLSVPGAFTAEATHFAAVAALCEGGRDNQVYAKNFVVRSSPSSGLFQPEKIANNPGERDSPILVRSGDRIGFMGDSITALGNSRKGYVQLVIAGLKAEGVDATAIPAGHSGDTSGNMVGRVNPDILHLGATWMTLSCGVNDVMALDKGFGVDLESYQKNVARMVAKARAWNVRVVLLTATPLGEDANSANNQKLASYNEFLRQFAAEQKLPLADMNAAFWKVLQSPPSPAAPELGKRLLADGIHPNEAGQFLMATTLLQAFGIPPADMPKVERVLREFANGNS